MCETALIIQHVLPKFQQSNDGRCYFNPDEYIPAILWWINEFHPGKVIVTKEFPHDELYPELEEVAHQVVEWKWYHELDGITEREIAGRLGVPEKEIVYTCA